MDESGELRSLNGKGASMSAANDNPGSAERPSLPTKNQFPGALPEKGNEKPRGARGAPRNPTEKSPPGPAFPIGVGFVWGRIRSATFCQTTQAQFGKAAPAEILR